MNFLLSKKRRDKSHNRNEFNSAMMVTRYDDIVAHNRLTQNSKDYSEISCYQYSMLRVPK